MLAELAYNMHRAPKSKALRGQDFFPSLKPHQGDVPVEVHIAGWQAWAEAMAKRNKG